MKALLGAVLLLGAAAVHAQQTVYMPIVIEVSGNGAVSGTNFRDGALMAIDEINANGGILKRKIGHLQEGSKRGLYSLSPDGIAYVEGRFRVR